MPVPKIVGLGFSTQRMTPVNFQSLARSTQLLDQKIVESDLNKDMAYSVDGRGRKVSDFELNSMGTSGVDANDEEGLKVVDDF